ncbi:MAG: hypothetical protein WAU75_25200 [Solirubrobacteraceae bacterium]
MTERGGGLGRRTVRPGALATNVSAATSTASVIKDRTRRSSSIRPIRPPPGPGGVNLHQYLPGSGHKTMAPGRTALTLLRRFAV